MAKKKKTRAKKSAKQAAKKAHRGRSRKKGGSVRGKAVKKAKAKRAAKKSSASGRKKTKLAKKPARGAKGKTAKRGAKTGSARRAAKKGSAKRAKPAVGRARSGAVPSVGSKAPDFALPNQEGDVLSSERLAGQPYILYFYPKDDTPGCTREACGFRDDLDEFTSRGVRVIGVSPDKPESHARFEQKYGLNFTLLSDVDRGLAKAYGAWIKKKNYGREYMGIDRSTFLVGSDGRIRKAWRGVKVDGHVDAVLDAAKQL